MRHGEGGDGRRRSTSFEDDRKVIGHIEEVLRDLGFDEKEFLYQKVEYYVIVSR
jgi:hypothetical protein